MRFPTIHTFLKWAGPSLIAFIGGSITLVAVLSQSYPDLRVWAEQLFYAWRPIVSAGWFIASGSFVILAYIAALIYTGGRKRQYPGFFFSSEDESENCEVPDSEESTASHSVTSHGQSGGVTAYKFTGTKRVSDGGGHDSG